MMNYYEGSNVGSLSGAQIIPHWEIKAFAPTVLKDEMSWTDIPFKEGSGGFTIKGTETDNGTIYTISGKFYIHNIRDEVEDSMNQFIGKVGVLRLTDMNGRVYIIGAPGMPVNLIIIENTGEKYTDQNGTEFQFNIDQPFPAQRK